MKFACSVGALIVLAVGVQFPARAQDTIKSLADTCRTWDKMASSNGIIPGTPEQVAAMAMDAGRCIGYIEGFLSGYSAGRRAPVSVGYCLPPTVSKGQIARVIAKKVEDHPELENAPQLAGMLGIMMGAWPCPNP